MIHARYDGVTRPCTPLFQLVGRIPEGTDENAKRYLASVEKKLLKRAMGLEKSGKEPDRLRETLDLVDKLRRKR